MENIEAKFFAGLQLSPKIRLLIGEGEKWLDSPTIKRIEHAGQTYLGLSISEPKTLFELKKIQNEIRQQVKTHYPDIDPEKITIKFFPQLFIR